MRKLIAFALALILALTLPFAAAADWEIVDGPAQRYLVGEIQTNAQSFTDYDGWPLWRWKIAPPSSDGKEVWLSFSCQAEKPGMGTLSTLIRTETGVFYIWQALNDAEFTNAFATDDTNLNDTFIMRAAETHNYSFPEKRGADGGEIHCIDGQFFTARYGIGTEPRINFYADFDDALNSELYAELCELIPWMLDAWQYVLTDSGYTMWHIGFTALGPFCRFHDWGDGVMERPPTPTQFGIKRYTCARCGKQRIEWLPRVPFDDVSPTAYYAEAVDWAVDREITSGTSETMFSPGKTCTRAQIVTFLWRAAGSPETELTDRFTDVKPTAYYAQAVAWAAENGITNGTSATAFSPNRACTRAQIVTMLWRAAGSTTSEAQTRFADVSGGAWYANAVKWASGAGITSGTGDGDFSPDDPCSRAQAVTFLWREGDGE
jgi:hypothetical protein